MPGTECVAGELARCEREVWVEWVAPLSRSYRLLLSLRSVNGTIILKNPITSHVTLVEEIELP